MNGQIDEKISLISEANWEESRNLAPGPYYKVNMDLDPY